MKYPIQLMTDMSLRVFVRDTENPTYCFFTDGKNIGYAQWGGISESVSSVHEPNKSTGTGFNVAGEITRETLLAAMQTIAPHWASASDRASVRKYRDIDDYMKASKWNSELKEAVK
jgi:hypothetical protein